ncbi:MAG: zinc-binding alcohol dehydrogenase [Chloroflexota bacterium]|nr:zinc-binding alcohol dehydrogenase [Chloroflexota bacterium]
MKASSLWFCSPRRVEFREENVEPPDGGDVLVEALYSGISHGTEMLVYRGEVPGDMALDLTLTTMKGGFGYPVKYGYASVGRVIKLGPDAARLREGDVVFVHHPHQTLYTVSEKAAVKLPADVDTMLGVFVANLESALNCLLDCGIRLGESVAVFGQGVVGLLIAQLARRSGAGTVVTVDRIEGRRAVSLASGADYSLDPEPGGASAAIRDLTGGAGADVVIEASGSPDALDDAIRSAVFQGQVVVVSWYGSKPATLHLGNEFHRQRIRIKSSQVSSIDPALTPRWSTARRMDVVLKLLPQLDLSGLVSDVFTFDEAQQAYEKIDGRPEEVLQVVLKYV